MVSAKDLRDMFDSIRDEAGKRASDAFGDAKMPVVVRRSEPPVLLWLGLGVVLGACLGVVLGAIMTPYRGRETRQKIGEQIQKARRTEEHSTNGSQRYEAVTPAEA